MDRRIVTVFGGSGFIGRHVTRRLAAKGYGVRAAVRDVERAKFLKPMGDVGQVVPWPADVTNPASVAAAVDGAELVVNLVGVLYESARRTFAAMHREAAKTVAEASAAAGARRLVHVSALGADRNDHAKYALTKRAGEEAVRAAFPAAVILRPSVVFGPEDNFFNQFAAMARVSPVLPIMGASPVPDSDNAGGPDFQPVYVGDVADAAAAALERDGVTGETFELGGPEIMSFREIMERVCRMTGRKRLLIPVPFVLAEAQAAVLGLLPKPPLTLDQVELLKHDNVVSEGAKGLSDLGVQATMANAILPLYLGRFKPNQIFGVQNQ